MKRSAKPPATVKRKAKTASKRPRARSGTSDAAAAAAEREPVASESLARRTFNAPPEPVQIVGLGASAGGLEALEEFFGKLPARPDTAFVLVQHLEPTHKGMLVELLQRSTARTVVQAVDGMRAEGDHVYVIPPGKDMSLLHGTLHLLPQPTGRGRILPIDFFFRSLAHDQGDRSIGVVFSGMGTDGTLGLRAIREAAGATFVQSPESAKYDSMPRSAIEAGLADAIGTPAELATRILTYRDFAPHGRVVDEPRAMDAQSTVDKICVLLRELSGNDFSLYKRSTIYRRIERRMALHQLRSFADYLRYLREDGHELELLFKELLIGVTSFFRDPAEWERLRHDVVPAILASRGSEGVRAWVAGCSTGEEAYSLAILLKEAIEPNRAAKPVSVQVFATDLDREAIEKARVGLYPENIAADVSPERLRRWFVHEDAGYRLSKEIRECVVFAPHNVIVDPPFTKVDIVTCRNLMIYLSADVQRKLIPLFHYCLNPGGTLFLGTAETIGTFTNLFLPLDGRTRLYRRLEQTAVMPVDMHFASLGRQVLRDREDVPVQKQVAAPNLQILVDRLIVQRFAPLGVLCTVKGDILYVSGRAGRYFEPPVGKANLNVFAMAREGLRHELSAAFTKAVRGERPVHVRGIKVGTNGGTQEVNLTVQKLADPKEIAGSVIVMVSDASPAPGSAKSAKPTRHSGARASQLAEELQRAHDEAQTIREEMQSSQEELRSTNEELQSTNEELQSTNEELTTSKEEMQSLNEELQTVNHELQSKVDELSRSNNDMKNLLNSTDIATLFLDQDLRVRRFTTATAKIIKLIPADIGRPITDIASDLEYDALEEDALEVLRTLVFKEKQSVTRDGRSFTVRIMPYRTLENVIDGVVITFSDTSQARALELAANDQASHLRQLTDSLPNLVWGARADGAIDYVSRQWLQYTGVSAAEQLQWGWLDSVEPSERERVREEWRAAVRSGSGFDSEFRIRAADGTFRWFKARGVPIRDHAGAIVRWYGTSTEIDALKHAERRVSSLIAATSDGVIAVDSQSNVTAMNPAAESLLGKKAAETVGHSVFEALPGARAIEAALASAPSQTLWPVGEMRYITRIERDDSTGHWVFLQHQREQS